MGEYVEIPPFITKPNAIIYVKKMSGITFQLKTERNAGLHCVYQDGDFQLRFGRNTVSIDCGDRGDGRDTSDFAISNMFDNQWHQFWMVWRRGEISLGLGGSYLPIITKKIHDFKHLKCIKTDLKAWWKFLLGPKLTTKTIKMKGDLGWVPVENGELPPGVVQGGHINEVVYVIRSSYSEALTPGFYCPSLRTAFISWGGEAIPRSEFEVLVGYNYRWKRAHKGQFPPGAVRAGHSENGQTLYIARINKDGHLIPGKLQCQHGTAYYAYEGLELHDFNYEVLVTCGNPDVKTLTLPEVIQQKNKLTKIEFEPEEDDSEYESTSDYDDY